MTDVHIWFCDFSMDLGVLSYDGTWENGERMVKIPRQKGQAVV